MRGWLPAGTHTLQLPRVQPLDSGTYLCEALNAAGRDQKVVKLSVLGTSCPYLQGPPLPWAAETTTRWGCDTPRSPPQRGRRPAAPCATVVKAVISGWTNSVWELSCVALGKLLSLSELRLSHL